MRVLSYSPSEEHLLVDLNGFPRYEVFDLPESAFAEWQRSADPVAYFNEKIWGNHYEHNSNWRSLDELLDYIQQNFYFYSDDPVRIAHRAGDGDTPLHLVTVWGDIGALELLLAAGAEVDVPGDEECTPLYNAASFEHARCVARLLEAGADPDAASRGGITPRDAGLQSKNPRVRALFE
jgi:ankyrin repeat protein